MRRIQRNERQINANGRLVLHERKGVQSARPAMEQRHEVGRASLLLPSNIAEELRDGEQRLSPHQSLQRSSLREKGQIRRILGIHSQKKRVLHSDVNELLQAAHLRRGNVGVSLYPHHQKLGKVSFCFAFVGRYAASIVPQGCHPSRRNGGINKSLVPLDACSVLAEELLRKTHPHAQC